MTEAEIGGLWPQVRASWSPQELAGARPRVPLSLQRERGPADNLILDFRTPELGENPVCALW